MNLRSNLMQGEELKGLPVYRKKDLVEKWDHPFTTEGVILVDWYVSETHCYVYLKSDNSIWSLSKDRHWKRRESWFRAHLRTCYVLGISLFLISRISLLGIIFRWSKLRFRKGIWLDLEIAIQSQKEKSKNHILKHICGIWKNWYRWSCLLNRNRNSCREQMHGYQEQKEGTGWIGRLGLTYILYWY